MSALPFVQESSSPLQQKTIPKADLPPSTMPNHWHRCAHSESLHRSLAEAEACPNCLSILPAPTRQRRNAIAVVVPVARTGVNPPAPPPPSPSWATSSSGLSTPPASRETSPANFSSSPQPEHAAYPTPGASQEQPRANHGIRSASPVSPTQQTFTATNCESPTPPGDGLSTSRRFSNTGLDRINRFNPLCSGQFTFAPPPPSNFGSATTAEDRGQDIMPPRPRPQRSRPAVLTNIHASVNTASTVLVPETVASPPGSTSPSSNTNTSAIPDMDPDALVRRLQDSTALTERLHTRAQIATAERERAEVIAQEAQAELAIAREELEVAEAERDVARGGRLAFLMKLKWLLVAVIAVGMVWCANRMLYSPEFEYVLRRSREGLGME